MGFAYGGSSNARRHSNIHGKEYKTVAYRVNEFREQHPDFTIQTDLVEANDVLVIVKASIFNTESRLLATGYAVEVRAASKINKFSALENAETSAIGRALSALGLAASICNTSWLTLCNSRMTTSALS